MREASETIARQVRNAVRETVSARRIQGAAGSGWTEKAIDEFLFRGSHDIMQALASAENVNALPEGIRRYIHDLARRAAIRRTTCKRWRSRRTPSEGDAKVRELEVELEALRQTS